MTNPFSKKNRLGLVCKLAVLSLTLLALTSAFADAFVVTAEKPGVQVPPVGLSYESFNNQTPHTTLNGSTFITNFGLNQYSGTYSGTIVWFPADQYGGAGGTGVYPEVFTGQSYTLQIAPQGNAPAANYFGMWFSALDQGNLLQFYKGNNLVYSFTPAAFIQIVGGCPNAGNAYCGNPTADFKGGESREQFAYLNFWDSNGSFDKVVFSKTTKCGGCGFESDNHVVAYLTNGPGGLPISTTPEPGTLLLLGSGLTGMAAILRRKLVS